MRAHSFDILKPKKTINLSEKPSVSCEGIKTFKQYLKRILEVARQGDAREESYYPVLKDLLNEYAVSTKKRNIHITILPKKTEAGNPDFRVWDGKQKIVGYIEANTPDKNLYDIEKSEQLKRYRTTFARAPRRWVFRYRMLWISRTLGTLIE